MSDRMLRREYIEINAPGTPVVLGEIPITLYKVSGEVYTVDIDGVKWFDTASEMHAVVLFEMMLEHITEYMHYEIMR